MATSTIKAAMGYIDSDEINLKSATWSASSSGKYTTPITIGGVAVTAEMIPGTVIGPTIIRIGGLRASDVLIPFRGGNGNLYLMSNANTFASDQSVMQTRITYMPG
jgi:hypothetical protein